MHTNPSKVLDPPTYTVQAFCDAHGISRSYLYELWRDGIGPRRTKLGRRTFISGEAAAEWRREMEQMTPQTERRVVLEH